MTGESDKFEVYQDKSNEWRWRRMAANGNIVGASSESYKSRKDAEANMNRGLTAPKPEAGATDAAEDQMIEAAEETMHEMRDAMSTMMGASAKMMQSFVDMRLSYLKVMRTGLEDPATAMDIATKNAADIAKAMSKKQREE
jgi:uncharacterized protein YegP (UPF0339 family)